MRVKLSMVPKLRRQAWLYVGALLMAYGFIGLIFELTCTTYTETDYYTWTFFNPFFVAYASKAYGLATMPYGLSFFASFATTTDTIATLLYWGFPITMMVIGFLLTRTAAKE